MLMLLCLYPESLIQVYWHWNIKYDHFKCIQIFIAVIGKHKGKNEEKVTSTTLLSITQLHLDPPL